MTIITEMRGKVLNPEMPGMTTMHKISGIPGMIGIPVMVEMPDMNGMPGMSGIT